MEGVRLGWTSPLVPGTLSVSVSTAVKHDMFYYVLVRTEVPCGRDFETTRKPRPVPHYPKIYEAVLGNTRIQMENHLTEGTESVCKMEEKTTMRDEQDLLKV